ncbi:MAG: hypothetical protein ACON4C_10710 [Henriciella sp.]
MNKHFGKPSVPLFAFLLHICSACAVASEFTHQDLKNAWKVKEGMTGNEVLQLMDDKPSVGLDFTDNYSEWHYCQTIEGLNEYFAIFFNENETVVATNRYVVGKTNGLKPGSCEASTRLGSFALPRKVAETLDAETFTMVTEQADVVLEPFIQAFREESEALQAELDEITAEKARQKAAVAAFRAKHPRYMQAVSIGREREINSILPEGAVQIVQINTTAMNELLELIVLQNDMIIELLEKQAEKE